LHPDDFRRQPPRSPGAVSEGATAASERDRDPCELIRDLQRQSRSTSSGGSPRRIN